MRKTMRGVGLVVLLLSTVLLSGCNGVSVFRMRISDFEASRVEGARLWRYSNAAGSYEPVREVRFGGVTIGNGNELIAYDVLDAAGVMHIQALSHVNRVANGVVELRLVVDFPPGEYRASLFNTVGESDLSSTTLSIAVAGG